jgi:hypothetical protein
MIARHSSFDNQKGFKSVGYRIRCYMQVSSIGFRTKTAKAVAIALKSDKDGPAYVARWNVSLYDPSVPATGQPYHEVMELPWENVRSVVRRLEERIERVATEAIAS